MYFSLWNGVWTPAKGDDPAHARGYFYELPDPGLNATFRARVCLRCADPSDNARIAQGLGLYELIGILTEAGHNLTVRNS